MTACRIFTPNGREAAHFILEDLKCNEVTVGRSTTCNVPLPTADATLSRVHFSLRKTETGWQLVDQSKSGTFKNGEKVTTIDLVAGDVFRFGQYFFCFGDKAVPSEYEAVWIEPGYNIKRTAVIWEGVNGIGASHDNEIFVKNEALSRYHGRIKLVRGELSYVNRNNFVSAKLNGVPVSGEVALQEGDELQFNGFSVRIEKALRHIIPVLDSSITGTFKNRSKRGGGWDLQTVVLWGGVIVLAIAIASMLAVFIGFSKH